MTTTSTYHRSQEFLMTLKCIPLAINCQCGRKVRINSLLVTEAQSLLVEAYCPTCQVVSNISLSFGYLLRQCPQRKAPLPSLTRQLTLTDKDNQFLSSIGAKDATEDNSRVLQVSHTDEPPTREMRPLRKRLAE